VRLWNQIQSCAEETAARTRLHSEHALLLN
jgi:hypothetical protein